MKVAVITGGSSGIGLACAHRLLSDGFDIAIAGRDRPRLDEAVEQLEHQGTLAIAADVAVPDDCARLVEETVRRFGRIDAVVNAAGVYETASLGDMDLNLWARALDTNVRGCWLVSRAALKYLKRAENGTVTNISSINGIMAEPNAAAYNASKAALISLTHSMAIEWAAHNVTVNAVAPGLIRTPMSESWISHMTEDEIAAMFPTKRLGEASEVADLVSFLCSGKSRYLTGEVLRLDGAMLSRIPGTR